MKTDEPHRMSRLPLLLILIACSNPPGGHARGGAEARDSAERAFAAMQVRGEVAMGVDQYSSAHQFKALPNGGSISLQRDPADSAGVARIRAHMKTIAQAFRQGDFRLPGLVHDREVPGTAVMTARRAAISYVPDTLPGGARLSIRTADPTAIAAIHEFLAFQRYDHRTAH